MGAWSSNVAAPKAASGSPPDLVGVLTDSPREWERAVPGQHAFPQSERLTRRQEYLLVYQQGEKRVGPQFICYTLHRAGQGRKIGFAVSRKVGGAVTRNRMKRYLREIYRTSRMEMVADMCTVIVARPASVALDFHECEQAVRGLFRAGGLLHG